MNCSKLLILSTFFLFMAKSASAQDWANLGKYKEENQKLVTATSFNHVVFMGDSVTEGWLAADSSFFSAKSYINRGISGQTSPQMLLRFRADVINLKPKVVVILAGTNDIAGNTGPSSFEMILDNIKSMTEIAEANKIKVILCAVLPAYDYWWKAGVEPAEKIFSLNKLIKAYAEKNNLIYADYFNPMSDERKGLKKEYSDDGVHPNKNGYAAMKPIIEKAISSALKK